MTRQEPDATDSPTPPAPSPSRDKPSAATGSRSERIDLRFAQGPPLGTDRRIKLLYQSQTNDEQNDTYGHDHQADPAYGMS